MKTWILAVVLGTVAIAPFLYLSYHIPNTRNHKYERESLAVEFQPQIKLTAVEVGATFTVMSMEIHDGYRFTLNLEGVANVEAHLPVATKDDAISVVIELLNNATPPPPTVTLLRCVDGEYWIVDIQFTKDDDQENLVEYLRCKDLLLD